VKSRLQFLTPFVLKSPSTQFSHLIAGVSTPSSTVRIMLNYLPARVPLLHSEKVPQPFQPPYFDYFYYKTKTNSVSLVREWTLPTERPPLVGEVCAKFWGKWVLCGQYNGSLRPCSRFSRHLIYWHHSILSSSFSDYCSTLFELFTVLITFRPSFLKQYLLHFIAFKLNYWHLKPRIGSGTRTITDTDTSSTWVLKSRVNTKLLGTHGWVLGSYT
jgi:hypothetical protein